MASVAAFIAGHLTATVVVAGIEPWPCCPVGLRSPWSASPMTSAPPTALALAGAGLSIGLRRGRWCPGDAALVAISSWT
jgi:hypothetical protein